MTEADGKGGFAEGRFAEGSFGEELREDWRELAADNRRRRNRRAAVAGGVLAGVLVVGGALAALGVPQRVVSAMSCGENIAEIDVEEVSTRLVPWEDLDFAEVGTPDGSPEELRERFESLGELIGTPVSGVVGQDIRLGVVTIDDTAVLTEGRGLPGTDFSSTLIAVDLPSGEPRWALATDGYRAGGGQVAGAFVSLAVTPDGHTEVVAFDPASGERVRCTRLSGPTDEDSPWDPQLRTTQVSPDSIALVHEDDESDELLLTRMQPGNGDIAWQVALEDLEVLSAEGLEATDEVIALSTVDYSGGLTQAIYDRRDRVTGPSVHAYATADGSASWTYPAEGVGAVIDVVPRAAGARDGLLAVRAALPEEDATDADVTLEMLDPDGDVVWSRPLGTRDYLGDIKVWDGTVVIAWDGITGYDVATGEPVWQLPYRERSEGTIRSLPSEVRNSERVGDRWYVPDALGGQLVDGETGEAEPVPLGQWFRVTEADGHVVATWYNGLVVLEPPR